MGAVEQLGDRITYGDRQYEVVEIQGNQIFYRRVDGPPVPRIEVGDYVTIGSSSLSWEVVTLHTTDKNWFPSADLRSGQTDRAMLNVPMTRLRLHSKAR